MKLRSTLLVLGASLMALAAISVSDSASAQGGSDRAAASRSVRLSLFPRKPILSITMRSARFRTGSAASTRPGRGMRGMGGGRMNGGMRRGFVSGTTTTSGGIWDRGLPRTLGIGRMDRSSYPTGQSLRTRGDFSVPMRRFRQ
jgi:hypothetical protein